jgi:putative membrane protein
MRLLGMLGLAAGLAAAVLLVAWFGAGAIWHALAALGWGGFAAVTLCHVALIGVMGVAWWLLEAGRPYARPPSGPWRFVAGRLIRDSASEALPFSQLGGYVAGVRGAVLAGVPGAAAAASTVLDVTTELAGQLAYTLLGLALLGWLRPGDRLILPTLAGVAVMGVLAGIFFKVQARGAGMLEQATERLARNFLGGDLAGSGAVQAEIARLHRAPARLLAASGLHLACWAVSGLETWLTLWLMGVPIGVAPALAVDSLLYGLRSAAFFVPNGLGVQEGGLILLGSMFGVGPEAALALSFAKRGRDLAIGAPALLAWQAIEGRRAIARDRAREPAA